MDFITFILDVKDWIIDFFQKVWDVISLLSQTLLDLFTFFTTSFVSLFDVIGYLPTPIATTFYLILFISISYMLIELVSKIKNTFF